MILIDILESIKIGISKSAIMNKIPKTDWSARFCIDDPIQDVKCDRDAYWSTAKNIQYGVHVGNCNMRTYLKVSCQHFKERVKPDSIDSIYERNICSQIIKLIDELHHG